MSNVSVFVSSPDTRSERRFDLHTTIGSLKARLETITGIPASAQKIVLYRTEEDSDFIRVLDEDNRPLGYYDVRDFQVLKVQDLQPSGSLTGQLTDVSQVEKFELSEQEYAKRQDSLLQYKQRNKLGRFAPPDDIRPAIKPTAVGITIGGRCVVDPHEEGIMRFGTVRFVGPTKFGKGIGEWVGIEYDEPHGKHDGTVEGVRYFTCQAPYGTFVRPERVTVGDFVVQDIELEEM